MGLPSQQSRALRVARSISRGGGHGLAHPCLACTSAWSHERLWPDRGRSRAQSLAALVLLYTKLVHRGPWRQGQTEGARLSWHVRLPSCYTHGRLDPCVQERVESLRTVRPLKANAIPMEHCNSSCTLHLWPHAPSRGRAPALSTALHVPMLVSSQSSPLLLALLLPPDGAAERPAVQLPPRRCSPPAHGTPWPTL